MSEVETFNSIPKMLAFTSQAPHRPPPPRQPMAPNTRPIPPLGPPPPHVHKRPPPPLGPPPPHVSARPMPYSSIINVNTGPQDIKFKNKIFENLSDNPPSPNILPLPPKEWFCSK